MISLEIDMVAGLIVWAILIALGVYVIDQLTIITGGTTPWPDFRAILWILKQASRILRVRP